jgi:hypothetical protein
MEMKANNALGAKSIKLLFEGWGVVDAEHFINCIKKF